MGRTALHWSARAGNASLSFLLLDSFCGEACLRAAARDGRTPFHECVKAGDALLLGALLSRAADAGGAGALRPPPPLEALTARDALLRTPLRVAAQRGDADSVFVALCAARATAADMAADMALLLLDPLGRTPPLCAAAKTGSAATVSVILAMCPAALLPAVIAQCNAVGHDALYLAARRGHTDVVTEILRWEDPKAGLPLALLAFLERRGGREDDGWADRGVCSPVCAALRLSNGALCVAQLVRAGFSPVASTPHHFASIDHVPVEQHGRRRRRIAAGLGSAGDAAAWFEAQQRAHRSRRLRLAQRRLREAELGFSGHCGEHERRAIARWKAAAAAARGALGAAHGSSEPQSCGKHKHPRQTIADTATAASAAFASTSDTTVTADDADARHLRGSSPPPSLSNARDLFCAASASREALVGAWVGLALSVGELEEARRAVREETEALASALRTAADMRCGIEVAMSAARADVAAAAAAAAAGGEEEEKEWTSEDEEVRVLLLLTHLARPSCPSVHPRKPPEDPTVSSSNHSLTRRHAHATRLRPALTRATATMTSGTLIWAIFEAPVTARRRTDLRSGR